MGQHKGAGPKKPRNQRGAGENGGPPPPPDTPQPTPPAQQPPADQGGGGGGFGGLGSGSFNIGGGSSEGWGQLGEATSGGAIKEKMAAGYGQGPGAERQTQMNMLRTGEGMTKDQTPWGVGRPGTQGAQSTAATVGPATQLTGPGVTALGGMAAGDVGAGVQRQEEKGLQNILAMKAGARQGAGLAERAATTAAGGLGAETAGIAGAMQMEAAQAQAGLEESAAGRQDQMTQMQASFQQQTGMSNAQMQQQNSQFNTEIDAQLATERDRRINELLDQGTSVEIAKMQVLAEMAKAKADLMYQRWSDELARRTELDVVSKQEESWYNTYNPETGEYETVPWIQKGLDAVTSVGDTLGSIGTGSGGSTEQENMPLPGTPSTNTGEQEGSGKPYAEGGMVPGRASDNTDSVPARLTPGELVIPKGLAQQLIDVIGQPAGGNNGAYQAGGSVSTTPWYPGKMPEYDEFGMLIREQSEAPNRSTTSGYEIGPLDPELEPINKYPTGIAGLTEDPSFFARPEDPTRTRTFDPTRTSGPPAGKTFESQLKANIPQRRSEEFLRGKAAASTVPDVGDEDFLKEMYNRSIGRAKPKSAWENIKEGYKGGPSLGIGSSTPRKLEEIGQDRRERELEKELGTEYWLKPPPGLEVDSRTGKHVRIPTEEDKETSKLLEGAETASKAISAASKIKGLLGSKEERETTAKSLLKEEGKKKLMEEVGEQTPAGRAIGVAEKAYGIMEGDTFEEKTFAARKLATDLGSKFVANWAGAPWAEGAINLASDKIDEAIFGDAPTKKSRKRIMKGRGIGGGSGLIHANEGGMVRGEGLDQLYARLKYPPQNMNRGGIVRKNYGQGGMVGLYAIGDRTKKGRK